MFRIGALWFEHSPLVSSVLGGDLGFYLCGRLFLDVLGGVLVHGGRVGGSGGRLTGLLVVKCEERGEYPDAL